MLLLIHCIFNTRSGGILGYFTPGMLIHCILKSRCGDFFLSLAYKSSEVHGPPVAQNRTSPPLGQGAALPPSSAWQHPEEETPYLR